MCVCVCVCACVCVAAAVVAAAGDLEGIEKHHTQQSTVHSVCVCEDERESERELLTYGPMN